MSTLRFFAPQFRSLPNPSTKNKTGLFFARATTIPAELRKWRDVNPRDVKKGALFKEILETLTESPSRFADLNRGLTISAGTLEYDENRREVLIGLSDPSLHGLVDGGHTLEAILEAQAEDYSDGGEDSPFVFVKVITGVTLEQIAEIAGGLNSSQQVDLRSLQNLEKNFDGLRKAIENEPYRDKIAYKMNQAAEIDVREILYYLSVFDASVYDDVKHPSALFGRKEGIVRTFAAQAADAKKQQGSFVNLISRAPEILRLRDQIEKRALKVKGVGLYKVDGRAKVKSQKHKKNFLHFLNESVHGKLSLGWIMPMLGGFRANVIWDSPSGSFGWRVPNEQLLDKCIDGLVAGVMEIHQRENSRPEYVGRSATAWRMCYDRVKNAILELEIEEMRKA